MLSEEDSEKLSSLSEEDSEELSPLALKIYYNTLQLKQDDKVKVCQANEILQTILYEWFNMTIAETNNFEELFVYVYDDLINHIISNDQTPCLELNKHVNINKNQHKSSSKICDSARISEMATYRRIIDEIAIFLVGRTYPKVWQCSNDDYQLKNFNFLLNKIRKT